MMRSSLTTIALCCSAWLGPVAAQVHPVRATQYLFLTNVSDARATWVNPAGLASIPEASVMAEFAVGRSPSDKFILDQFTVGFNSRGMSLAYLRNRFEGSPATSIIRAATGIPISGGALGIGVSLYGAPGENARGLDLGLLYGVGRVLTLGGAARNIGRPTVGGQEIPISLNGGGLLSLVGGTFRFAAEVVGEERVGMNATGWDVTYRGGGILRLPLGRPIDIIGAANLGSNFRIDQLHIGLALGGRSHIAAVGSSTSVNGTPRIERISVAGVSSILLTGRR